MQWQGALLQFRSVLNRRFVVLTLVLLAILVVSFTLRRQIPQKPTASKTTPVMQKRAVERDIKTTFTSSKHRDIVTYVQLASNQKEKPDAYSYYVKAYAKMLSFYAKEKDPAMKQTILELQTYAKTFSQYKASDFPAP